MLVPVLLTAISALADLKQPIRLSESRVVDNDDVGLSKTLEYNFSPEDRARLRKALSDYARNTDPDHQMMQQKRKAMHESISQRFNECNHDNDESLDREETTLCLPQVARHFSYVDLDGDNVITLDELETAYAKMVEKQRAAEAQTESQQSADAETDSDKSKTKLKPVQILPANNSVNSTGKDIAVVRKRPS